MRLTVGAGKDLKIQRILTTEVTKNMDFKIRWNRFSHLQNLFVVNVKRSKSDLLFFVIFPKTRTDKRDFTILIQQIGVILMMGLHQKRDLMEV